MNDDSVKASFGKWLAMSKHERETAGLPTSQAKWGELYGVDPRTLTRWKKADPVVLATSSRAEAKKQYVPAETPGEDELQGLDKLKTDMLAKALGGDEKAVDQYFKWFGKDELEERKRAAETSIRTMSDDELVASVLEMIGREAVEAWLGGEGT